MAFDTESLKQQIPYYLTAEDQHVLVRELKAIASGGSVSYVINAGQDSFRDVMLQGDGWRGFQVFLFETGKRLSLRGIVLSNSCDVDLANPRDLPARVIFAPLVKLSAYQLLLDASAIGKEKVVAKIASIKAQRTTNIFFLPAGGPLTEDYIVRFDEAHSMPVTGHSQSADRSKLFTLSNTGFYMLVFKLSVHFCRFQEKINRNSKAVSA
jgi:hypothetical protein